MKKQLPILALSFWLLALSLTTTAQTTRRVNGDPTITGVNVYNTVQAAVDAANTDDVILIEPFGTAPVSILGSSFYNENVTVTKRLHFIGNGYPNSETPINLYDKRKVIVSAFTFDTGSSGSTINSTVLSSASIYDENISFYSCDIPTIYCLLRSSGTTLISKSSGLELRKSLIGSIVIDLPNITTITDNSDSYSSDLTITNCILSGVFPPVVGQSYPIEGVTVYNSNIQSGVRSLNSSQIVNSLFASNGAYQPIQNFNLAISHSIAVAGGLPNLSNNLNNIPATDIWDNLFSFRGSLKTGSVAIGHGINGEDVGETGGSSPYEDSFLPDSPIATDLQNSQVGNNNINIQVQASFIAN